MPRLIFACHKDREGQSGTPAAPEEINFKGRRIIMGLLGSIVKIAAPIALTALTGGAAGPAMLQMVLKEAIKQAVMAGLAKIGQQMGIPPQIMNIATAFVANKMGDPGLANNMLRGVDVNMAGEYGVARQFGALKDDIAAAFRNGASQDPISNFRSMRDVADFAEKTFDLSPSDAGRLNNAMGQFESAADRLLKDFIKKATGQEKLEGKSEGKKGKMSLIMQLAMALGEAMDNKMERMVAVAGQLNDLSTETAAKMNNNASQMDALGNRMRGLSKKDSKGLQALSNNSTAIGMRNQALQTEQAGKNGVLSAELQGLAQELGLLSNALNTVIKSIGEANTTLARKG
jgi:hypothetical protein